ncbi:MULTISPECIES: hydrogenase formation protein HypD [unclassified Burkholderia]|uniref:hydrogenase formation protein HypD n=1 Tax=unclassified Burkholderia TaxID=2613784 RepID=UPI000758AB60|nr:MULTISPECIES: hydrogenase formation protein HypD [unclassified Burkholderia]KUY61055.1 hydrogenase formation protein HupD [Burkholderia sp. RF2-non_BP3]KUY85974.1 hydrogenase formation protein HupD [Burkholderia sp. RF4-BP95]KUY92848.1 hydrogenase formation protein HupD [Burkholderia sp. RF7-non_BP4]KUY95357.1 hydrogenase formation protein HupD [Burkholderia sp. RF7-non_BP1]
MKHIDEWRSPPAAHCWAEAIARMTTRPWTIMEICGGQTHSIIRYGIDRMLPDGISLLHGPGCPVCVTPSGVIDAAIAIASRPGVTLCSFGDMVRVPGGRGSLQSSRALGADVRIVYSPLDALTVARKEPDRDVVFFAIGFETTAPATAMAVLQAEREDIGNFFLLASHVLVPPAIEAILGDSTSGVQGFLAAGHVCTVMGYTEYESIARRHHVPIVVTGFEPVDLLQGLYLCIRQLEAGRTEVENQYSRAVRRDGNRVARDAISTVFVPQSQYWRGMSSIPESGLGLAPAYRRYDALDRFGDGVSQPEHDGECMSAELLRGRKKPGECPAFGTRCTPEHPLGATMVSSEGVCAAYYRYRRAEPTPSAGTIGDMHRDVRKST